MRLEKIIIGTVTLAGIISIVSAFRNPKTNSTYSTEGCETYQGYRNGSEGETYFVFDKETLQERGIRSPHPVLQGDPKFIDRLEIGQSYRLRIREGLLTKRLVSFQPCMDSEISNTKSQEK